MRARSPLGGCARLRQLGQELHHLLLVHWSAAGNLQRRSTSPVLLIRLGAVSGQESNRLANLRLGCDSQRPGDGGVHDRRSGVGDRVNSMVQFIEDVLDDAGWALPAADIRSVV